MKTKITIPVVLIAAMIAFVACEEESLPTPRPLPETQNGL